MDTKAPFNKDKATKIPFKEPPSLINKNCDYYFAIIDTKIDEELFALAKAQSIDLTRLNM